MPAPLGKGRPFRLLLIQPYLSVTDYHHSWTLEPLGLASLATYLKAAEGAAVEVKILDLYALGYQDRRPSGDLLVVGLSDEATIQRLVGDYDPDLIGISCPFTAYAEDALELAALIKRRRPRTPVVLGGAHATLAAAEILRRHPSVDLIVRGEGEVTLLELVRAMAGGDPDLARTAGLSFRLPDGRVVATPDRALVADLDSLPRPDRSLLEMDRYRRIIAQGQAFARRAPLGSLMTSRGCPFDCVFCSTKSMWRRRWRPHSAQRVIEEIDHLYSSYGIREFLILDDQFILDPERVHRICDHLLAHYQDISLDVIAGFSVWLMDRDLLVKLKRAGLYRAHFPIESGHPATLRFINKKIDLDQVKAAIRMANQVGLWTSGGFILGFPYESVDEIKATVDFACACGLDFVSFYGAQPWTGSRLHELARQEGLLQEVRRGADMHRCNYDSLALSSQELERIRLAATRLARRRRLTFYLHPVNAWRELRPKLGSAEDLGYALRLFSLAAGSLLAPGGRPAAR